MEHAMSYFTDDGIVEMDSFEITNDEEEKVSVKYAEIIHLQSDDLQSQIEHDCL